MTSTASRHGIYSANLVLLILALAASMTASKLFRRAEDPSGSWHRGVLLWRSSLTEPDWTDLALALTIRHIWTGPDRDLEISLSDDPKKPPEPIDPYWHYHYPPGHPGRGNTVWHRPYWDALSHKMDISSGTNDSAIRHALEPVFRWLGPSITTFLGIGDGPASSIAHEVIELWLSRTLGHPDDDPSAAYQRLATVFGPRQLWDTSLQRQSARLVLNMLRSDATRLPAASIIQYLNAALDLANDDHQIQPLILESALAAIAATQDPDHRAQLTLITKRCRTHR